MTNPKFDRYAARTYVAPPQTWASRANFLPADYLRAVRLAEAACEVNPFNGLYLNTLGVARYRAGQYRNALDDLNRSFELNAPRYRGPLPADMAFVATAQHRLGQFVEARKTLEQLRVVMKKQPGRADSESTAFLEEAVALIDRPAGDGAAAKGSHKK
ncbi:MAG: hypothetical protein ACLQIB_04055 [Isosphaeraceae bacterium]